jgi:hypothetical protein
MPAFGTPPTRVFRVYKLDANPLVFRFVLHEINELPVRPLVELFDRRRTLPDVLQILERDVLTVVCSCFFENLVSDSMEVVTEIP